MGKYKFTWPDGGTGFIERTKKERFKSDHIRSIRKGRSDRLQSPAMTITNKARLLSISLSKLDMCAIDNGERQQLIDKLTELKETINRILENVGAPT